MAHVVNELDSRLHLHSVGRQSGSAISKNPQSRADDVLVRPLARRQVAFRSLGSLSGPGPGGAQCLAAVGISTESAATGVTELGRHRRYGRICRVRLASLLLSSEASGSNDRDIARNVGGAMKNILLGLLWLLAANSSGATAGSTAAPPLTPPPSAAVKGEPAWPVWFDKNTMV